MNPVTKAMGVVEKIDNISQTAAKMERVPFLQWTQTIMLAVIVLGGGGMVVWFDNRRAVQIERMHAETMKAQDKAADRDERAIIERVNLSNAINNNSMAVARMEIAVMERLLGLKKDAETIKKDIKEVKESPKDMFGVRPMPKPRVLLPGVEVLPPPRPVDN